LLFRYKRKGREDARMKGRRGQKEFNVKERKKQGGKEIFVKMSFEACV
jgi:hypothetical protein